MGALAAWWQNLALRERGLIAAGVALVIVVGAYLFFWEPAADGIRKLRQDLPVLRAENASMRGMADEATRLRAAGGSTQTIAPAERLGAVRRSLARAGLLREGERTPVVAPARATNVPTLSVGGTVLGTALDAPAAAAPTSPAEVVEEANGRVRVRFAAIDYGVWIGWLAATESELSALATRVSVTALAPAGPVGQVRAEALLDWSAPASPPTR